MALTKRQIELELRASNKAGKTLDQVVRNVEELSDALEQQAKLAEKGQGSVEELTRLYDQLGKAGAALAAQKGITERVDKLRESVQAAQKRVDDATDALNKYRTSLDASGKVTEKQAAKVAVLERAVERANAALSKQADSLNRAVEASDRIGATTDKWAQAQESLNRSSARMIEVRNKVNDSLDEYSRKIEKVKRDEAEMADARSAVEASNRRRIEADRRFEEDRTANLRKFEEARLAEQFKLIEKRDEADRKLKEEADRARQESAQKRLAEDQEFERKRQETLRRFADAEKARGSAFSDDAAFKAYEQRHAAAAKLDAQLRKMGTTIEQATEKEKRQAKAMIEMGQAAQRAGRDTEGAEGALVRLQKTLIGGERTSLGFFQRLRGEVLAIIAAYGGLQGAIDLARTSLDKFQERQANANKLLIASGRDAALAQSEYENLRRTADRLGVEYDTLIDGYAKFRIAAKEANVSVQDTRFIFESIAEGGRKLQLSTDAIGRINYALTQLVSKGKASTEEIGQQLGDHLPGVMQFAAKQFGVSVAEFRKHLENGEVDAVKAAIAIARGMNEAFKGGEEAFANDLAGSRARFQNALADWKTLIAESGLADAYKQMLSELTTFLKSEDGKAAAVGIAEAFAGITKAIVFLVKNVDTLKVIFAELVAVFSAITAVRLGVWLFSAAGGLQKLAAAAGVAAIPLGAIGGILAALVAIPLAVWAYENFEPFRKAVDATVIGIRALWEGIVLGSKVAASAIRNGFVVAFNGLLDLVTTPFRDITRLLLAIAKQIGAESIIPQLQAVKSVLETRMKNTFLDDVVTASRTAKRELESLRRLASDAPAKITGEFVNPIINPITGKPLESKKKPKQTGKTEESGVFGALGFEKSKDKEKAAAEKYANLLESLTSQVEAVNAQALKKNNESLESVLAGIDKQYESLFRKLGELRAGDAARLKAILGKAIEGIKQETREDFDRKSKAALDALDKKFAELDAKIGRGRMGERESLVKSLAEEFRLLREEVEKVDPSRLADLAQKEKAITARQLGKFDTDTAKAQLADFDNLLEARNQRLQAAQVEYNRGLISEGELYQRNGQIIAETQPILDAAAYSAIQFIDSLRGREGVDTAALDAIILKLKEGTASAAEFRTQIYSQQDAIRDLTEIGVGSMDALAKNIADSALGLQSWSDGLKNVAVEFGKMTASILMDIAKILAKEALLSFIRPALSGFGGLSGLSAGVFHGGGVVGSAGGRTRLIDPSWFANAPRYHGGGVPGLASDEYAAVLKRGEEVLNEKDPRNVLNGGMSPGAVQSQAPVVKVVNTIDSGSFVSEGLSTSEGTQAVMNFMRANRTQLKSILG